MTEEQQDKQDANTLAQNIAQKTVEEQQTEENETDFFEYLSYNGTADALSITYASKDTERVKMQRTKIVEIFDNMLKKCIDTEDGNKMLYSAIEERKFLDALRDFAEENTDVTIYVRSFIRVQDFTLQASFFRS